MSKPARFREVNHEHTLMTYKYPTIGKVLLVIFIIIVLAIQAYEPTTMPYSRLRKRSLPIELTDTGRIRSLLDSGSVYLFKRASYASDLKQAYRFFNQALALSKQRGDLKRQADANELLASCYLEDKNLSKGTAYFKRVTDYYHKIGNIRREAYMWSEMGDRLFVLFDAPWLNARYKAYQTARDCYVQGKDRLNAALVLQKIAEMRIMDGENKISGKQLEEVLSELKAVHYTRLLYTFQLFAAVNRQTGNLDKELYYILEAAKNMQATKDTADAKILYFRLARCYEELGMTDQSLHFFSVTLHTYQKVFNPDMHFQILREYVYVLTKQGQVREALKYINKVVSEYPPSNGYQNYLLNEMLGTCYFSLRQNDLAEKKFVAMIAVADRSAVQEEWTPDILYDCYLAISNFYLLSGQYIKANYFANKLLQIPAKTIRPVNISQAELIKSKADSAMGNLASSIIHFEKHIRINDSLFNATKNKQVAELQIKYETEAKNKDLLLQANNILLLKKQSVIQENEVEKSKTVKNVVLAGTSMLFLLLAILYNRYRLKQRSNLQLHSKQKEINQQNEEISKQNQALLRLISEKEWLLREVHHRVKNNLQIVMSLLYSQSAYLKDEVALNAVMDSQHRVQAMSMIHQKLYQTEESSAIYMPEYIHDLVEYLKDSFKLKNTVYFDEHIEPISLDVVRAVPVGLIINEIITNAIKHAFPKTENDHIRIELRVTGKDEVSLTIADNGKGMPPEFNINNDGSFGMMLIKGLTEDLGGTYQMENQNGTIIRLMFNNAPLVNPALNPVISI